uniref:Uncharacterized protein n=1 Tax=Lepeophtheirus salmonis TaxID=72036 RepID=A0A0K2TP80_LEPSM
MCSFTGISSPMIQIRRARRSYFFCQNMSKLWKHQFWTRWKV